MTGGVRTGRSSMGCEVTVEPQGGRRACRHVQVGRLAVHHLDEQVGEDDALFATLVLGAAARPGCSGAGGRAGLRRRTGGRGDGSSCRARSGRSRSSCDDRSGCGRRRGADRRRAARPTPALPAEACIGTGACCGTGASDGAGACDGVAAGGGSCDSGTAGAGAATGFSNGTGIGMVIPAGGATGPVVSGAPCEPGAGPLSGGASGMDCPAKLEGAAQSRWSGRASARSGCCPSVLCSTMPPSTRQIPRRDLNRPRAAPS